MMRGLGLAVAIAGASAVSMAATLQDLGKHTTEFQLPNGLRFAVVERPEAPLVSFHLVVRAGIADEPAGKAGVARMFERMYWHGGENTGSINAANERAAIARAEQLMDKWREVDARKPPADPVDLSKARVEYQMAAERALTGGHTYYLRRALEANGATATSALVEADSSGYAATLPSHRAEVWFRLVGDWLRKPSPRFFYLERDAWLADWRNQQSPQAILEKAIAATAFPGHPYSRLAADVAEAETLRVGDFEKFALAHYVPSNSVVAIVGDISAAEARRLATQYFGPIPASAVPPPPVGAVPDLRAVPELREDKPVSVALPLGAATPTAMAWPRPARTDPDDAVFDVVWAILTGGRELSLASGLDADKIAATPGVLPSFPGDRLPAVFAISAVPLRAIAPGDLEKSLDAAVGRLRTKPISDKELAIVKAGLEARLLSETERPGTMAALLARFLASDGSVEAIGKAWQRIDKVTPADIQRVAGKYLRDRGRVILQATQGGD